MDENDLKLIKKLLEKAVLLKHYDLACSLKETRNKLNKHLNDKLFSSILEQINKK